MTQSTKNKDNSGASQYCCGEQFEPAKSAPTEKLKKEDPLVEAIHLMRSSIENDLTKKLIQFWKWDIEKSRTPSFVPQSDYTLWEGNHSNVAHEILKVFLISFIRTPAWNQVKPSPISLEPLAQTIETGVAIFMTKLTAD